MNNLSGLNKHDFWLKFDYDKSTKILQITSSFPTFLKKEEEDDIVIEAPTFNLFAYGSTIKEAQENLFYQLNDFFDVLISKGRIQLTKWLTKLGWKYDKQIKEIDSFDLDLIEQSNKNALDLQVTNINNNVVVSSFA